MDLFESRGIDVGINLGGADVGVSQHFLNGANGRIALHQLCSKRMAQGMG